MSAERSHPDIVRYAVAGTLGELPVLTALTDVPQSRIQTLLLPDHGLRIQQLDDVRSDFVRDDLRSGWDERGVPFYGATTLFRVTGEHTPVHVVDLPREAWEEAVRPRLQEWNYHAHGWFSFREVHVPTQSGLVACIAEFLPEEERLQQLPQGYRRQPEYQLFIRTMEQAV